VLIICFLYNNFVWVYSFTIHAIISYSYFFSAIHDYLMSDTTLLLVASNLGLRELIKSVVSMGLTKNLI